VCRDSSFGVERYKHCTDPSFGVSGYKICRHESFGVESYNTCQLLKTTHELNAFVANTKERIPEYAGLYALHQGQVLSTIGLKNDMACLIRGYGNRPLHGQIVADLSEKYTIHFLENYRDNPVDCSERVSSEELANFNDFCSQFTLEELNGVEDPSTQHIACRSKKSSLLISSWFQDKSSEIGALINDVVSRNNTQIRGELSSLSQMIETEPAFTE
jgi:hypothetical protein